MSDNENETPNPPAEQGNESSAESHINLEEFSQEPNKIQHPLDPDDHETLGSANGEMGAVYNVPVQVSAVLGKATMPVSQLLKLGRGAVVELDRRVGEAIDIYVNNRLVARGEVVVVDDRLGITMTEIIKAER